MASKQSKLVLVEWEDSAYMYGKWHELEPVMGFHTATCFTVGWVMRKGKKGLVLASSIGSDEVGDAQGDDQRSVLSLRHRCGSPPAHHHLGGDGVAPEPS